MLDPSIIRESVRLSDVIGQTVELKPRGQNSWIGLCCFHKDSRPSLTVSDDYGTFKCWSCSAHGDLLEFLQLSKNVDFKEAVSQAKVLAGIEDEFIQPSKRRDYETKLKALAEERRRLRKWKAGIIELLICYTTAQWAIYRIAKRQLIDTFTEELEQQSEIAFTEAVKKEAALDEFEQMSDNEVLQWYRCRRSWQDIQNPKWWLSRKKLEVALLAKENVA